jgi:hypothetical protein
MLGVGQVFRPQGLKVLSLSRRDIPIKNSFETCLDCGLMWGNISQKKLLSVITKTGSKRLKRKLGIE